MDRVAVLVDVGYLLAEGGKAYCGVTRRSQVRCDYGAVAASLENLATAKTGLPVLRQYWYDGAPENVPTQDHHRIGALPRVMLRLGRLVERRQGVEQKGVDSLIVHDLITLAHERAVATVVLVAGDKDLREGVAAAQRLGVQVILAGIPTTRPNQSDPLIREADEVIHLDPAVFRACFARAGVEPGVETQGPLTAEALENPVEAVAMAGTAFAAAWAEAADSAEIGEMVGRLPEIPRELDVQLLVSAEEGLGRSLRANQEMRHALRAAFWAELVRRAQPATSTAAGTPQLTE